MYEGGFSFILVSFSFLDAAVVSNKWTIVYLIQIRCTRIFRATEVYPLLLIIKSYRLTASTRRYNGGTADAGTEMWHLCVKDPLVYPHYHLSCNEHVWPLSWGDKMFSEGGGTIRQGGACDPGCGRWHGTPQAAGPWVFSHLSAEEPLLPTDGAPVTRREMARLRHWKQRSGPTSREATGLKGGDGASEMSPRSLCHWTLSLIG